MHQLSFDATSHFLQTDNGPLHYHEAGSGPALIMLHGSGPGVSGWSNFGANLPVFAQHFRTIIIDLPGYGRSAPASGHPMDAGVNAVRALLDHLDIGQAHVLGNSFGAMVGSRFCVAHPERVNRFVTVGGFAHTLFSSFPPEGLLRLVEFVENPSREALIVWMKSMVFDPQILTDELIDERYKTALDPVVRATSERMYSRASMDAIRMARSGPNGLDELSHLPKITMPTLITWGRDDRVSPLDGAMIPMRYIPNCELHVFPKCGHWAMIERKAQFENVTIGFLTRDDAE